jgi:hypothetical protein
MGEWGAGAEIEIERREKKAHTRIKFYYVVL